MKTEKLYETDGMLAAFRAHILSCTPHEEGYAVILDRTAFFPEGGGQTADTGRIGGARVTDVQIVGGEILHFTDKAPCGGAPNTEIDCELDFAKRFRKMQNHLGEHLLCGAIHKLYGFDNVGFHLGADYMTFDINGVLTADEIRAAERAAGEAVAADATVLTYIPEPDALAALEFRAKSEKLEAAERIRIVEIAGFDRCACCAPHLDRAGKVGMIKIVESMHYKGGMRFWALCGFDALADYDRRLSEIHEISALLSAKPHETPAAVKARLDELAEARSTIAALRHEIIALKLALIPESQASICLFAASLDTAALREFAMGGAAKTDGIFAVCSGTDEDGYRFAAASTHIPLREKIPDIRTSLGGKCGGSDTLITGQLAASEAEIRAFFA